MYQAQQRRARSLARGLRTSAWLMSAGLLRANLLTCVTPCPHSSKTSRTLLLLTQGTEMTELPAARAQSLYPCSPEPRTLCQSLMEIQLSGYAAGLVWKILLITKTWRDSLVSQGVCCQGWQPELDPRTHVVKTEKRASGSGV